MATQITKIPIRVSNPDLAGAATTYLTQDSEYVTTTLILDVASEVGFDTVAGTENFYILLGEYGEERSVVQLVNDGQGGTNQFQVTTDIQNIHSAATPVTKMEWNQVAIFGVANGVYTQIGDPIDIDVTSQYTEYNYEGTTYDSFATVYYNSYTDEISGYSDIIEVGSFTRRSAERIIKSAAQKALTTIDENANSRLNWDIAVSILQDGMDEVAARKKRWPFWNTSSEATVLSGAAFIAKPTDLTQLISIKADGNIVSWVDPADFNQYTTDGSSGIPQIYTEKNGNYYVFPRPNADLTVDFDYYKVPDVVNSMTDEIAIPLVPVLIYYCGAAFSDIRGNDKRGDKLYKKYVNLLEDQVEEYSGPSQDGSPEYVRQTSALDEGVSLTF